MLTAIIWGFAFVAQRVGMESVGPFTFNGIRFALGGVSLLPLIWVVRWRSKAQEIKSVSETNSVSLWGGVLAGVILFIAATLQQVGVVYTTAGKAGFITGIYVVLVPILGLIRGQRSKVGMWIGVFLSFVGLYLLSVEGPLAISFGDLLVFIGAFFWALHVHIIGWLSTKMEALVLSFVQFIVCALLSLCVAVFSEPSTWTDIQNGLGPILYGGLLSVGVAYTFQVLGQRHAHPVHAAIILSLETVFAGIGGWLILGETFSLRGIFGCVLMLAGMLVSQLGGSRPAEPLPLQ